MELYQTEGQALSNDWEYWTLAEAVLHAISGVSGGDVLAEDIRNANSGDVEFLGVDAAAFYDRFKGGLM